MNRKLIRPSLSEYKEKMSRESAKKKQHPQYETYAENYYYLKQMNKKTNIAIVFTNGEKIEGYIEWYDKNCIKVNRDKAPNLLVYKNNILYIYKLDKAVEKDTGKKTGTSSRKK